MLSTWEEEDVRRLYGGILALMMGFGSQVVPSTNQLPAVVPLPGVFLIRGSDGKYYEATDNDCSCPDRTYRPDKPACKHMLRVRQLNAELRR